MTPRLSKETNQIILVEESASVAPFNPKMEGKPVPISIPLEEKIQQDISFQVVPEVGAELNKVERFLRECIIKACDYMPPEKVYLDKPQYRCDGSRKKRKF